MTFAIKAVRGCSAFAGVALFVIAVDPAFAQQQAPAQGFSPTYQKCMNVGTTTVAMLDCGAAEYRKLDAQLNAAYRKALDGLTTEQRVLLRDTQRAWLAHRDASCSFMTRLGDRGTMASLSDQSCLLAQTAERTKWLEGLGPL
jgi:uncharacterized protein YecT (DUF1311 family)